MATLDIVLFTFHGKDYLAATIPDVFTESNEVLLIGSHSLGDALYNDNKGYIDEEARDIDERIYSYIDDKYFSLSHKDFLEKAMLYLD